MNQAEIMEHNAAMRRNPKQRAAVELKEGGKGGVVAHHGDSGSMHEFGPEEGHLLAAHLESHFGIKMPHVAAAAEPVKEANGDAG